MIRHQKSISICTLWKYLSLDHLRDVLFHGLGVHEGTHHLHLGHHVHVVHLWGLDGTEVILGHGGWVEFVHHHVVGGVLIEHLGPDWVVLGVV